MAFSGALTLTDLNDFITPSQACIKPVEQTNKVAPPEHAAASTQIQIDSSGTYYEVSAHDSTSAGNKLQTAEVSLNDCLACSGCITSAESVLITLQSHTEVLNFLAGNAPPTSPGHKVPVLSIAPQSLASLAASLSSSSARPVDLSRVLRRVRAFCTQVLGFEHVYDTTFARHVSLLEHAREFAERKQGAEGALPLPMLASACPGWVCYAEKTHGEMLPFISRTKSPQQVMGTLVKEWLGPKWGKVPSQIYHVTVMPCYDKKLEASRQDFYNDVYATRDVDCVLTTGELAQLMRDKGWDLATPVAGEYTPSNGIGDDVGYDIARELDIPELIMHPGTSSGSYLQSLISTISATSASPLELSVRAIRSADYEEHTLTDRASGAVVFRGAKCYGFRNLQNVVRKVGREAGVQVGRGAAGRTALRGRGRARKAGGEAHEERGYDYVEVMACPGGCVNGGGQLKPAVLPPKKDAEGFERDWEGDGVKVEEDGLARGSDAKWGDREWTKKVEEAYWHGLPTPPPSPTPECVDVDVEEGKQVRRRADRLAEDVLFDVCKATTIVRPKMRWKDRLDEKAEMRRRDLFRTQYRAVESEVVGLAVKW
ncbi:Cytosolic Fe-S cluster assembly factor NAR1 [Sparassis crispa]|uniref:Cytosolic Fe-S cluster assembly factor NAR1 n=1 Tax=Sparassis crispa TaxID=139825 RepID=A0A401GFW5_9APHY|nr:Cytosolic Fe-S cluster assembly factor NAR1 [Sparassis crispa]GBE81084.1 Cytosolic Fe-S cluster assembly factor NAR1 [Sparassis crispa]